MVIRQKLLDATFGICGSLVDLFIWQVALVGASVGKTGPRGVYEAFREADEILQKVNHNTLKSTWHQLTKKRLITYGKRNHLYSPQITKMGQKRLKDIIPVYLHTRSWDKRIYLITYDIPEKYKNKRDSLRYFLVKIHAKLLQESIYLTSYNPREMIRDFIREYQIPGTVIVSDVGSDGGVGENSIQDLLTQLYSLEKLNDRYEVFMKNAKAGKSDAKHLLFEYLSILRDDPQLPFELLPRGWLGDDAYILYEKLKNRYINSFAAAG